MIVIPTILTDDPEQAKAWVGRVVDAGKFDRVQVDFVDGQYANNLTISPTECHPERYPEIKFDAHLMVVEKNIDWYYREVGRLGFDRIVVQMESVSDPEKYECLAIDVHSPAVAIEPYLSRLKYIVVLAVEPGFGGQKFEPGAVKLIERLNSLRETACLSADRSKYKYKICVDGGVQKEHLEMLEKAGADETAVGAERALKMIYEI